MFTTLLVMNAGFVLDTVTDNAVHAVTRNRGGLELWLRKGQWQCFDLPSPRSHLVFICTLQQCAQNCFLNVCGIPVVVADGIPRFLARYLHFHLCRLQRKTESVSQC